MRLRDLTHWHLVSGVCHACGRRRRIPNNALRRSSHGERDGNHPLYALADALRCDSRESQKGNFFAIELKKR